MAAPVTIRRIKVTCLTCSIPAPAGARYCGQCGAPLPGLCPRCDALAEPGTAFCTSCGTPLGSSTPAAPPDLAGPLEERRFVSVLAVDLAGFSSTAQVLEPEDLQAAQRGFFSAVATAVLNTGGIVAKRIGDAVIAVYGAPVAHENDSYRAVRGALELQRALAGQTLPDGRPLVARAGVSTGEAIVTTEPGREVPRIAGEVLGRAMSLQAAAPPGSVLVGAATHRMTAVQVHYDVHAPVPLGPHREPGQTWVATGTLVVRGQLHDVLPLVGREPELGLLVSSLDRVLQERRGQLVALVGEPGLGKSRLARALGDHLDSAAVSTEVVRWRLAHCLPYGEGVTYWALGQIVKTQAGILESDGGSVARTKLEASVDRALAAAGGGPEGLAAVKERLAALVGLPGAGAGDDMDASHAAWRRYLLALAADTPTVLVVEDLHWADDGLLEFLRSLAAAAATVPLMILCTARPELMTRTPSWLSGLRDAMTLTLTPLPEAESATVLSRLLGDAVLPEALRRRLLDLVGGNPLYAEEYVRMLADSGVLQRAPGQRGGFALDATLDGLVDLPLPDSVQGVVDSRLDLLTAAERTVVSAATVVGEVFWEGAVAAVADADRDEVRRCLQSLERREVVARSLTSTVADEAQYVFRHVLVRDAAYGRIPRSVRVVQHRRCAEWLDTFSREGGADVDELRAHHRVTSYELAAVLGVDLTPYAEPARAALTAAAEHALRLHAVGAAHAYARRALLLWHGHEDDPQALMTTLLAAELSFLDDPHTFYTEGGPATVEATAGKLLALGNRRAAARAHGLLGQCEWYRGGGPGLAAEHLQRAVDLLAEEPASEQSAGALAELARLRMLSHQYAEAAALGDRAMSIARPLGLLEVEANALVTSGTARYSLGDPLGIAQQEEALRLARQHDLRAHQRAANNLAATLQEEGRLHRSYELIEESARATRGWGLSLTTRADESEIALKAWYDGDWDRLLAHTAAFLDQAGEEARQWESYLLALACIVHALRREPVPADLARVVRRASTSGFPALVRSSVVLLGGVHLLEGRVGEARSLFDELLRDTEMSPRGNAREWVHSAVLLASFLGGDRLEQIAGLLGRLTPKTPWTEAAEQVAASLLASADGKHVDAVERASEAVAAYARIGDVSTTVLVRVHLARSAAAAGDLALAREQQVLVREFTARNKAPLLEDYLPSQQ